jgi:integrase
VSASLKQILRFFGCLPPEPPASAEILPGPASAEILKELLAELEDLGRSKKHIRTLRRDAGKFLARFPRLENVTPGEVSAYLRGISSHVGPRRRNNIRNSIVQLFSFARERDYLPEERRTAAEKIKQINAPHDVVIWSPGEAKILLEFIPKEWLPCEVIGLFAGLRRSEIFRLDWSAFKWHLHDSEGRPAPVIAVTRHIARKIRTDRLVPILPTLAAWLLPYRHRVGPLYPGNFNTIQNLHSIHMVRLRRETGLARKDNANRHSFGTYRSAMIKNVAQLALEMGTSPRKVRENYNNPQPEELAREYFDHLLPPSNVVPMNLELSFESPSPQESCVGKTG